jgi:predicted HTH transcriptional regulator
MAEDDTNTVNTEQVVPNEPTQTVNETAAPAESTATPATNESETQTAQMGRTEPLPERPQSANETASSQPAQTYLGKDILVKARATIQNRKHMKLEKIVEHVNAKGHITNDEVEKLLHVSDATATRYLSQLEREGKIKQIGTTGKAVTYTKP